MLWLANAGVSEKQSQVTITNKGIIAAAYNDTTGTPVLFDKKYFEQLALLNVQYGAKKLLQQFKDDVAKLPFALGAVDIDTKEDYENLKQ